MHITKFRKSLKLFPFTEFKHIDSPCLKETVKVKSNLEFNHYEQRMFLCYWYLLSIIQACQTFEPP